MRVHLLDDSLTGWAGHNAGYDFAIQDELAKRGMTSLIFANIRATDLVNSRPNGLRLVFRHYADLTRHEYAHVRLPAGLRGAFFLLIGNWNQFKDLVRGVSSEVKTDDVIIATMQLSITSFANALWLFLQRVQGKRLIFLFLIHNYPSKFFRAEWQALRILGGGHKMLIGAHTKEIAAMCQDITGNSVLLFPLPFANRGTESSEKHPLDDARGQLAQPIVITYLGMATIQKGYDLVIRAIEAVEDLITDNRVAFIIQFNSFVYDDQNLAWKQQLLDRFAGNSSFTLIEGPLDNLDYVNRLQSADVVLVPNRSEFYSGALSGVFTEAVAIGKPVIIAEGTYMAAEVQKGMGVGVSFRNGDANDLARAIRQACADYVTLRSQAQNCAAQWREGHSPERFVDILMNAVGLPLLA